MSLFAFFFTVTPGWFLLSAAIALCELIHSIETHASAVALASAVAITFTLVESTEAVSICISTMSAIAASRFSCSLLTPAASRIAIIAAVVASTFVVYDASLTSSNDITNAVLVTVAAANACLQQLAASLRLRSGLRLDRSANAETS
eukprot:3040441-Pleurochrysis_carterae.AAC.1